MCVERSVQPQNNAGYDKPSYSILSHPNDSEHRIFLSVSIRCLYTVCCSSSLSHSFDTTYGRLSTPTFYLSSSITLLLLPAAHVVFTAEPPNRRTAEPHSAISQSIVATIPSCLCITFLDYLLNRRQPLQVPNTLLRYMFRCCRSFVLVIGSH